jgi:hypothetical protein
MAMAGTYARGAMLAIRRAAAKTAMISTDDRNIHRFLRSLRLQCSAVRISMKHFFDTLNDDLSS